MSIAMRKNDKHEPYCGCQSCKPTSRALVILKPEERPLLEKDGEKQRPPEGPLNPPHTMGGNYAGS
jgi:hypothetical protein